MSLFLPQLIAEIGDVEFADMLGAPVRTVQSWRRRERLPRPEQAREIIRIANGRISFDGIYGALPEADVSAGVGPANEPAVGSDGVA